MQSASTNITTFPGKVGISNANPTHTLAIGSNVYVDDTGSNKLTVTGIISGDGLGVSNIQTTNVLGLSDNVTRIATLETDLGDNSSRISTVSTDLGDNSSRITDLSSNLSDNSSRITDLSSNLSDNSSRITTLESGDTSISGDKTFTGDIIFESNVHMNGNVLVANTINMTVSDPIIELGSNNLGTNDLGIIMTRPNNNSNVAIVYDEDVNILRMGYTLNGASDSIIDLDSNALAVNVQGELTVGSNLEVGTANLFVDTTTGKVSIGAATPQYKLDVDGGTTEGDGDVMLRLMGGGNMAGKLIFGRTGTADLRSHAIECKNNVNTAAGNFMKFLVHDGGNTPPHETRTTVMTLQGDGNVGIGETSPAQKLDVDGRIRANSMEIDDFIYHVGDGDTSFGFSGADTFVVYTGNTQQLLADSVGVQGQAFVKAGDTNTMMWFPAADNIAFMTGGTERMRIDSSGRVGIGTTNQTSINPTRKFELGMNYGHLAGYLDTYLQSGVVAGMVMGVKTYTGTQVDTLYISDAGRVGIGTTTPTRKFELGMNSGHLAGYIDTYVQSGVVAGMILGVKQSFGPELDTLYINDSGRVGIGTTSPDAKLEVRGESKFSYSDTSAMYIDSGGAIRRQWIDSSNNYYGSGFQFANLAIYPCNLNGSAVHNTIDLGNGGTRWKNVYATYLYASNNVGIGTSSPLAPLDIPINTSGTISVNQYQGGYYWTWNTAYQKYYNSPTESVAINADGGWVVAWGLYAGYSIQFLSDRRIKKDIREIDDDSALEKFRRLKPSKYKYIEPAISGRTDKEVYGFIAQEVAEVLPEGVSIGGSDRDGTNQGHIPNIMSMCSIESQSISSDAYEILNAEQKGEYTETGNTYTRHVVTITRTIDPSTFNVDGSTRTYKIAEQTKTTEAFDKNSDDKYHPLVFYGKDLKTMRTNVVRVIDDSSFVVDKKLDLNKYEDDELLLYGQKPDDFYRLNKDAIFTLASAALQEVDRQLQAEKAKVTDLLARVKALENA